MSYTSTVLSSDSTFVITGSSGCAACSASVRRQKSSKSAGSGSS
jgi:hypothetical protein